MGGVTDLEIKEEWNVPSENASSVVSVMWKWPLKGEWRLSFAKVNK